MGCLRRGCAEQKAGECQTLPVPCQNWPVSFAQLRSRNHTTVYHECTDVVLRGPLVMTSVEAWGDASLGSGA